MKKVIIYVMAVVCFFLPITACKKDKLSASSEQTITISLKNTDLYQYELGNFGDEEGASISKQAMHYNTSKIDRSFDTTTLYIYKPAAGYVGTDEVTLKAERGSNGASPNTDIIITNSKFTITE